jgi:cathepsin F
MIYQFVVALTLAVSASASFYSHDVSHQRYAFDAFKVEHRRTYASAEEEAQRFANFVENLKLIDTRNANERKAGGTAVHGITKFADMTQEEFKKGYLTARPELKKVNPNTVTDLAPPSATAGLVDWTGIYTTPIKDQV